MWHQCNHGDCRGNGIDYITLATILWEWREHIRRIYNDNKEQYTSSHTGINIRAGRLLRNSWSSFGFLHRVADERSSSSGECIASVFRVTDSDSREYWSMLGIKECVSYTGNFEEVWTIRAVGDREVHGMFRLARFPLTFPHNWHNPFSPNLIQHRSEPESLTSKMEAVCSSETTKNSSTQKATINWSRCLTRYLSNVIRYRPAQQLLTLLH